MPTSGYALTYEDDYKFQYQTKDGEVAHKRGVVAMSIVCTDEGLSVVDCNLYHYLEEWNNTVTAVDYLHFNEALQKTFNNGVSGIVGYMQKHMPHLVRLPVVTVREALSDTDRSHRNQRLDQDVNAPAQSVNDPRTLMDRESQLHLLKWQVKIYHGV